MNEAFGSHSGESSIEATSKPAVAIVASFTAFPVLEPLRFWLHEVLHVDARLELAEMGQVMQTLLDPKSIFAANFGGLNVILLRWEDLCGTGSTDCEEALDMLISGLSSSPSVSLIPHVVCLGPPSLQVSASPEKARKFREMDARLKSTAAQLPRVFVVTSSELLQLYPVTDYADSLSDRVAWIPYRTCLFAVMATLIARRLHAVTTPPYKAIVVDCDQTLWAGACGEDGPHGVVIDGPRRALQEFLIAQHEAGMLICLCSKNSEEDVLKVFEQRGEMLLKLHHIVAHRINWESKAANICSLAQELGIGTDSFVFVDDNPLECAEVRAGLPEVLTLQMPADSGNFALFLRGIWAFDHRPLTREDGGRTAQYLQERERKQLRNQVTSLAGFLAALDLQVRIRPLEEEDLARSAQLTLRVNQFNLSSIRRSEAELTDLWHSQTLEGWAVEVSDRFGDYGQVGLLLLEAHKSDSLKIDTFLLSCRALGRGVEHQMLAALGALARERGLRAVELPLTETSRNRPMRDFLQAILQHGGQAAQSGPYVVPAALAAHARYLPSPVESQPAFTATNLPPNLQPATEPAAGLPAQERSRVLARIAMELATPQQILSAFESWQRTAKTRPENEYVAPRNGVESTLTGIWAEVLGIEQLGTSDAFFELDGDSLKMVQIIVRVLDSFGVELPISLFFEHPTIEAHAKKIIELRNSTSMGGSTETAANTEDHSADAPESNEPSTR
jgi:FkbH-like protein